MVKSDVKKSAGKTSKVFVVLFIIVFLLMMAVVELNKNTIAGFILTIIISLNYS